MRTDIRESPALKIDVSVRTVVLLRFGGNVLAQVRLNRGFLVPGGREVEAETAGAGVPGNFWVVGLGAADGGDVLNAKGGALASGFYLGGLH